jgi:acyl dehydratase
LGSPGLEMIKWHLPVYPGDVLSGRTTVLESRPMNSKPEVGLLKLRYETCNQDGVAVMTMEGWGMMRRRGM